MSEPDFEVAVIGAGPGGIAAAHQLQRRGIDDFVILERGGDFGGTWRDNHYPGLAVDIPTLWYQLSFAPNPDWSRFFAPGPEIHQYLRDAATRLNLYPRLRTGAEVVRQQWDDASGLWRLSIRDQPQMTARFLISSVGGYVNAKNTVDIDGIEDFAGTILRPNAWDDSYDTHDKRIAVIGTGSSGVQITAALSAEAANLDVYQRTPAWVLPKADFDIPPLMRRALRVPGVFAAINAAGRAMMDVAMIAPIVHVCSPASPTASWSASCRSTTRTAGPSTDCSCAPPFVTHELAGRWYRTTASWRRGRSSPARSSPRSTIRPLG
jgi:cation diffusion facilitator CzcD-associated flavoprotein CzcO